MKDYLYDVFLSFTGADREMKNAIRVRLEEKGLTSYDSDLYCQGQFRDDFCEALDRSRVYLMILSDNLRNDPVVSGKGCLTEVRRECDLACQLEAANELNIVILCMSEFFRYDKPFHDYNDVIGWHFYSHTRGFSRIDGTVNGDGTLSEQTLATLAAQCKTFVDRRNAGSPVVSQAPKLEIASEKMLERGVFKGREGEIKAALEAFGQGKQAVVLSGMGGIGKTTLATEIARRCEELGYLQCPQIVHIQELGGSGGGLHTIVSSVRYEQSVYNSITALAERDKYERKLNALCNLPETVLLVVDNYNSLKDRDIAEAISKLKCRILITTRSRIEMHRQSVSVIPIGCLDRVQAAEMFCEICGDRVEESLFSRLYDFVGGHTITLCIMARMLAVHRMPVSELLSELGELEAFDAKVDFEHNEYGDADTVLGHLKKLFGISDFSEGCKRILRSMAILGDGTIALEDLMQLLSLKNRNEIIELTSSGWLELQKREAAGAPREYLYLHPIISRLMASLLVPTEENVPEMIDYLIRHADGAKKKLTYADATVLEDGLFYACYVLAGGDRRLSHALWTRFVDVNHLLGDAEDTAEKVKALTARITDADERDMVVSYGDMVTLEQYPTRVEILDKYVGTLDRNAKDYHWLMRSLSVTLPYITGVEKHRVFLVKALDKAFEAAMVRNDDFSLLELTAYFMWAEDNCGRILKRLKSYIRRRKREGVKDGALLYLEMLCTALPLHSTKNAREIMIKTGQLITDISNNTMKTALRLMLRHPLLTIRSGLIVHRIKKLDDVDPMTLHLKLSTDIADRLVDDGKIDAEMMIQGAISLHALRVQNNTTLASAANAVMNIIGFLNDLPEAVVRKGVGEMVESLDMENVSVQSFSTLQVAALINQAYGNREAIAQSRQLIDAIRHLRPEGHGDILDAISSHGDICAMFNEQREALRAYVEVYRVLVARDPTSAKFIDLCRRLLNLPIVSYWRVADQVKVRDYALADLDYTASMYYTVYNRYACRLLEKASRKEIGFDDEALKQVWGVLEHAASNIKHLDVLTQNTVIQMLDNIIARLANHQQYEQAEGARVLLMRFTKSKKKAVRINARIQSLQEAGYIAFRREDENTLELLDRAVEACVKHSSQLSVASITTWLMICRITQAGNGFAAHRMFYKNLKTLSLVDSWQLYFLENCMRISRGPGIEPDPILEQELCVKELGKMIKQTADELWRRDMGITIKQFRRMRSSDAFYKQTLSNIMSLLIEKWEATPCVIRVEDDERLKTDKLGLRIRRGDENP